MSDPTHRETETVTPADWPAVLPEVYEHAKRRALETLATEGERRVQDRLAVFYDSESNYAGSSFAELAPNEWWDITPADLHATTLLSVDIGPAATRRLIAPGATRQGVLRALRGLPDRELAFADADTLTAMEGFYRAIKVALGSASAHTSNPWVTASKLCARKRPDLFPVRDRNVCGHLGIIDLNDFRVDWLVFRALAQDDDVIAAVDDLPSSIRAADTGRLLAVDSSRLRLLDAAIWTYTTWYRERGDA